MFWMDAFAVRHQADYNRRHAEAGRAPEGFGLRLAVVMALPAIALVAGIIGLCHVL